jgi:ATP-dependent helicase/nuclease subunit A
MSLNPKAAGYQQRASDPGASAWVNANAGSGKTHVLVDRVIRLLLAGTAPSRLLCLTFTKAAAAEMALRISERLGSWLWLDDEALAVALANIGVKDASRDTLARARRLFAMVQETPGGLKIQTIHAFCERLLQLFPVEAGVVPQFTVMDDRTAAAQRAASRDDTLIAATQAPDTELGEALRHLSGLVQADQLDGLLAKVTTEQGPARALLESPQALAEGLARLRALLSLGDGETLETVRRDHPLDRERWQRVAAALAASGTNDQKLGASCAACLQPADASLLDLSPVLLTKNDEPRSLDRLPAKDANATHPWVRPFLQQEQERLIAALKRAGNVARYRATAALLTFAQQARARYEERKRALGHYDFDDLITRSNALLAETPDAAWVLYKLDGGIDHVLLDEAQDTSPAQWSVIEALTHEFFAGLGRSAAPRSMFAVGDRKQSIFSFQGADPDVFLKMRDGFQQRVSAAGQAFRDETFNVSFRSVPEVLRAVDAVFAEGRRARAGLDGAGRTTVQHDANRHGEAGLVELWDPELPDDGTRDDPWTVPVDRPPGNAPSRKLARRIATTIKSWIGRRRIAGNGRLVQPADILILVRRRNVFFDQLISALRLADVPVAGADRLKLGENIAVLDLLALGSFATLPRDDYSLACVLKSPLMERPYSEDELMRLAQPRGTMSLWQAVLADQQPVAEPARRFLQSCLEAAPSIRPFEFFAGVLQQARPRFIARLGSEADDALNALLEAALAYEAEHTPSLAGFLAWFQSGEIEIKRNMEQAAGEVRIMTVHGAKGLEAPIVFLPDTLRVPENHGGPQVIKLPDGPDGRALPLWCVKTAFDSDPVAAARQRASSAEGDEYRRLLYVAMTRAGDELYVCGYEGKRAHNSACWYDLIREGLSLSPETPLAAVAPGVWRYGATPGWTDGETAAPSPTPSLPAWIDSQAATEPAAGAAQPVTRLARGETLRGARRDEGPSRGHIMHRLLQLLPDTPEAERERLALQIAARAGHGESLAREALALLAAPDLAWLFDDGGLSEVVLSGRIGETGLPVSGRIDRLVVTTAAVTIVDYKTDHAWPESPELTPIPYVRQLALYRQLLREAYPGRLVRAALLWTSAPKIMHLPDDLLEAAWRSLQPSRP